MNRRDFMALSSATIAATAFSGTPALGQDASFTKRFASTDQLAAYTRLSALLEHPAIMAHRAGYYPWGGIPECSIFGAEQVIKRGPAFIEIDVRTSADGVPVCVHDETLDRGTTGTGRVDEVSADYIAGLTLRDNLGQATGYSIPTFEDFLDWGENGAMLWLDTKDIDPALLVEMVRARGAESRVIVSAYGREILEHYQELAPDLVYFVPFIEGLGLPDVQSILDTGLNPGHLIGMAGFDLPNMKGTLALAEIDAPALLDVQNIDRRYEPGNVNPNLYTRAVEEGLPFICTDQYSAALDALGITDWA
ncbi:glycerophosphodiester phosphodiesterase family protein [Pelagibacterium sp. H642]|uniref:glycerophosphodiester phosphodiesterase family protein n=1 Tax=Pelagibacterium sp. H642 TaxID=1881069 RepID=UPI002814D451|nr:glycerophosphodiester phosphodiesterase family protein [Pelagibacterium sp. H642]WMT92341.1 glycerophosphodiester phosphodiesterase family protein [Pelagibacterium sp. H642]